MKTLVLLATTLSVVSLNVLPAFAASPDNQDQSMKTNSVRVPHAKKDLALKQESRKEDQATDRPASGNLDYADDSFIID